jgi:hypothetical protein
VKPIRPEQARAAGLAGGDIHGGDIDGGDIDFVISEGGDGLRLPPDTRDRRRDGAGRRSVGMRWCVTAVGLAAAGALAGGLLYADRTRTVGDTRTVASPGYATADLIGCPVRASCALSEVADGGPLLVAVRHYLPAAVMLRSHSVSDANSARPYLVRLAVRTPDGILLTLTASYRPSGPAAPAWRSPLPAVGPADIALVVPGRRAGTALAVTATVPAGIAVPAAALRALATDPSLQLTG